MKLQFFLACLLVKNNWNLKKQTALGEVFMDGYSDTSSILVSSTNFNQITIFKTNKGEEDG